MANQALRDSARTVAAISIFDIGVFFAVLLVGIAYPISGSWKWGYGFLHDGTVDTLETIVDDALWSLPKYRELLFIQ